MEMLGTPYFMAPEIIRQERHGRKVCCLFVCLFCLFVCFVSLSFATVERWQGDFGNWFERMHMYMYLTHTSHF